VICVGATASEGTAAGARKDWDRKVKSWQFCREGTLVILLSPMEVSVDPSTRDQMEHGANGHSTGP
jgi:uncharacterized membrane protein